MQDFGKQTLPTAYKRINRIGRYYVCNVVNNLVNNYLLDGLLEITPKKRRLVRIQMCTPSKVVVRLGVDKKVRSDWGLVVRQGQDLFNGGKKNSSGKIMGQKY